MKAIIQLITTICFIAILSSCETNPFDYRNKYVGQYEYQIEVSEYSISGTDTTYNIQCFGEISKDEANKNQLNLITDIGSFSLTIVNKKSGEVTSCGGSGDFDQDGRKTTINFNYSSMNCAGSGLGGYTTYKIYGIVLI